MPDDSLTICDVLEEEMVALDSQSDEGGPAALDENAPQPDPLARVVAAADRAVREERDTYLQLRQRHHAAVAAEQNARDQHDSLRRWWVPPAVTFRARRRRREAEVEYERTIDQAERQRRETEHERLERLVAILHQKRHSALCFSGGGIRSATFCLGVLQGMSHQKLLQTFDYLSTVSGGGYVGSWLSGWMAGHKTPGQTTPPARTSIRTIENELANPPAEKLDGELPKVNFLRAYSNYLSPQVGLLSADSWTLAATVVRNMFLNWMILVPLLAVALLVPYLALQVTLGMNPTPHYAAPAFATLDVLLILGFFSTAVALGNIAMNLPSVVGQEGYTQPQYLWNVLFPLVLSAILLDAAWIGYCRLGVELHALGFVLFGAILHLVGWFAISDSGVAFLQKHATNAAGKDGFGSFLANDANWFALVSGAAGGWAAYFIAHALDPKNNPKLATWLALPITLALYFLVTALFIGLASKKTSDEDREWWARSGAWLMMVITAWLIFGGLVIYGPHILHRLSTALVGAGGLLSGWLGSLVGESSKTPSGQAGSDKAGSDKAGSDKAGSDKAGSKKTDSGASKLFSSDTLMKYAGKLAPAVFLVCLLLVISKVADTLAQAYVAPWIQALPFWPKGLVAGPFAVVGFIIVLAALGWVMSNYVNVNTFSLHAMYRSRLIRAYLGASNPDRHPNPFTGFDPNDNLAMYELSPQKPLHVLNMALNLVHGERLAWQQRKAETFTVTRLHAGSMWVRYRRTKGYGDRDGITLGTAMAISGAAASPNMGYHSSPLLTFLMTFFNARLGWWLPNPGPYGKGLWSERGPKSALESLVAEALGLTDDKSPYVYLSDGGHFENLGLYEMVLRRCHTIVAIDAGADPKYIFDDLANAIRKIRVDLGVPIRLDKPIRMTASDAATNIHCVTGSIGYGCIDKGAADGTLVYIKPVLDEWQSVDIDNYHTTYPDFPQQSTTDQFFDESQFESYRRLGQETIERICQSQARKPITLADFVTLATSHSGVVAQVFRAGC